MKKLQFAEERLAAIRNAGLFKEEKIITSPQSPRLTVRSGAGSMLNMCANNYLGLANHPEIIEAARRGLEKWGFGLASVRFICGTQQIHKQLERQLSGFLGTDDAVLYSSCFDANGGLFETLLGPDDAVISDELNHASIIDGIRLCKAERFRYRNRDMVSLEEQLRAAAGATTKIIATDGVFSMDGTYAPLEDICRLADKYQALVMVDDSHAVGFTGVSGGGTPELFGVKERVDLVTGTFGKALGGAGGGYTAGRRAIIELLRQRSRPYLFSNTLSPAIVCAAIKALELARDGSLRHTLHENTMFFREAMRNAGFDLADGDHPIVPIMIGDALAAQKMAEELARRGVYAVGFFYPVVPEGKARIRVQISAAHNKEELAFAVDMFREAWRAVRGD